MTGHWLLAMLALGNPLSAQESEFFEAKVRPVLVEHCFSCHGPKKQNAGLRLDSRQALLQGSDNGPVVVPGHPEKSPLVAAVQHIGPTKMPPKGKLSPQAIEALSHWVKLGVPWPDSGTKTVKQQAPDAWKKHWAFQPIRQPPVPTPGKGDWALTAVDQFILAGLEAKKLRPSEEADRRTLIRRVTFDLIGLPPMPQEVEAFLQDESPEAWAKVVDRLLASPHYGERWSRYWLDVARYADTKGYVLFEEAPYPWAYTYRDYVIRAFNEDLPYDRFILEQLAADQLALGKDLRPLTGLGFLTAGGRFMNNVHDVLDDRIDVVTRGLMGLTVTCARCHDHKYDPIPTKDYYSLYGVFASCAEPVVPPLFQPPPQTEEYVKFDKELKEREKKLTDYVRGKHQELKKSARTRMAEYLLAAHALRNQPSTDEFMLLADTNDLNPTMVQRWKQYLERRAKKHDPVFAPWFALAQLPEKDFASRAPDLLARLTQDAAARINPLVAEILTSKLPQSLAETAQRYSQLLNELDKKWTNEPDKAASVEEEQLRKVFHGTEAPANFAMPTYGDLALLPDRPSQAKMQEYRKALESWRATGPGAPPRAMVLEDLPTPFQPRVFLRGNPSNLGEKVPRQLPEVLASVKQLPFQKGSGRLELAHAIASRDNPLTARVLVNRLWLHHFGAGLVRTPGDFGLRSDPPTHPELLDHLASYFMDQGWSIKKLHRLILLSRVYRQKSHDRTEALAMDPENRLWWKMNRRRLDFEATRDALLAVSGKLDPQVGGPSVKDNLSATGRRRTLYTYLDRLNLPGLFRTFDFPSPDASSSERPVTTVAPQALFLMNNPFVLACARHLANRPEMQAEKDAARRVSKLYHLTLSREPTPVEQEWARNFLGATDPSPAAWERFAHALLMSNEFMVVD
jgi:mono/diheme cytochrome c family protein